MSARPNPICTAFDEFSAALHTAGPAAALDRLKDRLAVQRRVHDADAWTRWCAEAADHRAFDILLQDPYARDARFKPAGYAGDARTLDYVYLREYGGQRVSNLGSELFGLTTGAPIAAAIRHRRDHLAGLLTELTDSSGEISAVSLACGHARELDRLSSPARDRLVFWGLDPDDDTVTRMQTRLGRGHHCGVGSVPALVQGTRRIPMADVVYSLCLFDYLSPQTAVALIRRMCASLRPGGKVIVASLTIANDEIAFMEAVLDWWMAYRDASTLRSIACEAGVVANANFAVETYSTGTGRVAWLRITRMGLES